MSDAKVSKITVPDATVSDAKVPGATLSDATVSGATLSESTVSGPTLAGGTVPNVTVSDAVRVPSGPDQGAALHYGDPLREQRHATQGKGWIALPRDVLTISGPDRLGWLHTLTTQKLDDLQPEVGSTAYLLSAQGHIEHVAALVDDGTTTWIHTEPNRGAALFDWLQQMRFRSQVEVTSRADLHIVWTANPQTAVPQTLISRRASDSLGGAEHFVSAVPAELPEPPLGTLAYHALRIAAGVPRIFADTDARTIPNELGVPGHAVHLEKGCYRGQETVARVHNLGRPPRRLTLLHLDGTAERLPGEGAPILLADQDSPRPMGMLGTSARHFELGPIALGLVKRGVAVDAPLVSDGIAISQEVLVDPEVGQHFSHDLGRKRSQLNR